MRRRPPRAIVAYNVLVLAILVGMLILVGPEPAVLFGVVILGGGAVGLYFRIRIVWVLVIAFHIANILAGFAVGVARSPLAIGIVSLALLLAPQSRRYFRREPPPEPASVSRAGRAIRLSATVVAGLVLGLVGHALLFPPDPVGGDLDLARSNQPGLRVLFVGTTLTGANSMIETIRRLGESDGRAPPIFAVRYALRGSNLQEALDDDRLTELLAGERWNYVVLQEHSRRASRAAEWQSRTLPAAAALDTLARRAGAQTVLFSNPGYEDGDDDLASGDTRQAMQARLIRGYLDLARRLGARVAPVGDAWEAALRQQPQLDLWIGDGIRPTKTGSYLTACVLYAVLTRRDPAASAYDDGPDPVQAQRLRSIAGATVSEMTR